jgi:putative spermidine/putrescine transport system substrate-binding protein
MEGLMRLQRRQFMIATGATLVAGGALAQEPPKPKQIVVNASGGSMNSALRKAYFDDFEKETGIRIVETSPVDLGKLKAMVGSGAVEWNLTEIGGQDGILVQRLGLVDKIDPKVVDRKSYPKEAQNDYLFASSVYSTVLAYRTDVYPTGKQPKGWAEFWDVKKFPGPRSMRNHPVDNLEYALLADGVPADKLYPIDLDRAFKKLDEIKPHVNVWWTTGQQPAQLLLDKEVVLATGWNGRFFDVMKKGAPIATEWTHGSLKQGTFVIPKGAKDQYWGNKMLAYMSDPKRQSIYANELGYPGLNLESIKYIDAEAAPHMPTHPDNLPKQFWLNVAWWDENLEKAMDRWKQWLLKK